MSTIKVNNSLFQRCKRRRRKKKLSKPNKKKSLLQKRASTDVSTKDAAKTTFKTKMVKRHATITKGNQFFMTLKNSGLVVANKLTIGMTL